jgi:hypothetical protein
VHESQVVGVVGAGFVFFLREFKIGFEIVH